MEAQTVKQFLSKKPVFIGIGLINILVFHYAILRLWFFLFDTSSRLQAPSLGIAIIWDFLLILFFSIPHSLLLRSDFKSKIMPYIPKGLYETFYGLHACIGIILMDEYWMNFGDSVLSITGSLYYLVFALNILAWAFMLWSMIATGLFRQSGIEHWYMTLKGKTVKNQLLKNGPYSFCRHPIYASFLAMIWITPHMNMDHLFLSLSWTAYILIGALLKDKRLMRNKGYANYMTKVPAYPLVPKAIDNLMTKILRKSV